MDCKVFSNLLDDYINGALPADQAEQMRRHAETCGDCAALLSVWQDCSRIGESFQVPEDVSSAWRQRIREEAELEETQKVQRSQARPAHAAKAWGRWLAAAAALVFIVGGTLLTKDRVPLTVNREKQAAQQSPLNGWQARKTDADAGTGSEDSANKAVSTPNPWTEESVAGDESVAVMAESVASEESMADLSEGGVFSLPGFGLGALFSAPSEASFEPAFSAAYEPEDEAVYEKEADWDGEEAVYAGNKAETQEAIMIRTAGIALKTVAFEDVLAYLQTLTEEIGGRVEYLSSAGDLPQGQDRSASMTLRIPTEAVDGFLDEAQSVGTTTEVSRESQDVSDAYYDLQNCLETLQTKLKRLQKLKEDAAEISDVISIESAIADTRCEMERYIAQISGYDSRVEYSTVRVSLQEIKEETAETLTLGQRIGYGFQDSLNAGAAFMQNAAIFLISAAPWLAGAGIIALLAAIVAKAGKRKEKKSKQEE